MFDFSLEFALIIMNLHKVFSASGMEFTYL